VISRSPTGARQFLDPAIVARIGPLELKARVIVEGFLQGLHRSPFRGFSVEFAEYRPYLPGDDLASIDWKVYARSDRYYVKTYEHETNLPCHLLLDVSGSMAYGSGAVTKLEYGSYLAAALAYLLQRQRDAVGLLAFDADIVAQLPPSTRPGHLRALLAALERLEPGVHSDFSRPLERLAEALNRRGLVIVMSDLFDEPERVVQGLRYIRSRGTEVIVFHLLDPAELAFTFDRPARFRDLESAREVLVSPRAARAAYLEKIQALVSRYRHELRGANIDYCLVETSRPLDAVLLEYLAARSRRV
jgi:uncharacterized protein (DUF58 family)